MKELLKNGGILLLILGSLVLIASVFQEPEDNLLLAISALLVVTGIIGYIVGNRLVS